MHKNTPSNLGAVSMAPCSHDKKQALQLSFHIVTHRFYPFQCLSRAHLLESKHTRTYNSSSSAIKAISEPQLEAKIETCSEGWISCIRSSICLAALDNSVSFACKEIVPINPINWQSMNLQSTPWLQTLRRLLLSYHTRKALKKCNWSLTLPKL